MANTLKNYFDNCPGLLFVAGPEGCLVHRSKALDERFAARLGQQATLASLAAPEDAETVEDFLRALAESDGPAACSFRVPDGDGRHTKVCCQARRGSDGSIHGQLELVSEAAENAKVEHVLLHAIMNTLEVVLWAVDRERNIVFQDGKALASAGLTRGQFVGKNIHELYPPEIMQPIEDAFTKGIASRQPNAAHDVYWDSWTIPVKNAAGEVEYSVGLSLDISPTARAELELARQLETIKDQRQAIQQLSAPVIKVWDQVLTVPLVGVMDNERASELTERLLAEAAHSGSRFTILDLTGVESLDTSIASHILRLLGSLRLLGVEGMVTGISPHVAQTMVGIGVEFGTFETYRSLRDGLRACMLALSRS